MPIYCGLYEIAHVFHAQLFTMKTNAKVTKKLMQTVNEMSGEMNWTFDTVWEWFLLNVNTS